MKNKNLKKYRIIVQVLSVLVLLGACNKLSDFDITENECLGSFEEFAYTVQDVPIQSLGTIIPPPDKTPPLTPWQIETLVIDPFESEVKGNLQVEITRSVDGSVEVWVKRDILNLDEETHIHDFLIYKPESGKWARVSAAIEDTGVFVNQLYVANDGSLWGRNHSTNFHLSNVDRVPILSKLNEHTRRFEFDKYALEITIPEELFDFSNWAEVLLDPKDVFWIIVPENSIYSYDLDKKIIVSHAEIIDLDVSAATLAPNGTIYFKREFIQAAIQEDEIFQFNPKTGKITSIEIPDEPWPSISFMKADQHGRLWLNAVGWREQDGTWHLMHQNTEDYFENIYTGQGYRWGSPEIILESSNGYLWFKKPTAPNNGTAWFDPVTGDSCWFTNVDAYVVEDADQNLWLVADGKLYKYALNP